MGSDAVTPPESTPREPVPEDPMLGARIDPSTHEMARARGTILAGMFPEETAPAVAQRYALGPTIGRGGLGRVYRAHDQHLGRDVAMKFLRGSSAVPAELEREARVLAKLQHPNIVTVYDVSAGAEEPYLTMELIEGMTLARWLREHDRPRDQLLAIFEQAARGLAAAHEVGIVHRDFKPANVMISDDGRVRVVDFGLARAFDTTEAPTDEDGESAPGGDVSRVAGTRPYMAPEQFAGQVSAASDQFAFCTSLYEALCGHRPWREAKRGITTSNESSELVGALRRASVPRSIRRLLVRGLQREPSERFASMQGLLTGLQPRRARRWAVAALGVALVGVAGLAASSLSPEADPCEERGMQRGEFVERAEQLGVRLSPEPSSGEPLGASVRAYAERWNALDGRACREHASGSISDTLHDLRVRCLQQSLESTGYLLDQLESASNPPNERALANTLRLDECTDDDGLLRGRPEPDDDPVARDSVIAAIDRAHIELSLGRQDRYVKTLEKAHQTFGTAGAAPRTEAWLVAHLGHAWIQRGDAERVEALVLPVLLQAQSHPTWVRETGDLRTVLAQALVTQPGRVSEARMLAMEAAAALATLDDGGQFELVARSVVATAAQQQGEYDEALTAVDQALTTARRALADPALAWFDLPLNASQLLALRAGILLTMGRNEEAEHDCQEALGFLEQLGGELMLTAQLLNHLAIIDKRAGRRDQAIGRLEEAASLKARLGHHEAAALTLKNIGNTHMAAGQLDAALAAYDQAIGTLPAGSARAEATVRYARALAYQAQRRWPEAQADLERAGELAANTLEPENSLHYVIELVLGMVLVEQGQLQRARRHLQHARTLETPRTKPGDRAELLVALSRTWMDDDRAHAEALAVEALAAARESTRKGLEQSAATQLALAKSR